MIGFQYKKTSGEITNRIFIDTNLLGEFERYYESCAYRGILNYSKNFDQKNSHE